MGAGAGVAARTARVELRPQCRAPSSGWPEGPPDRVPTPARELASAGPHGTAGKPLPFPSEERRPRFPGSSGLQQRGIVQLVSAPP